MTPKPVFPLFPTLAIILLALANPPAQLVDVRATFELAWSNLAASPVAHWLVVNAMTLLDQLAQVWRLLSC
jgi:hypothetical protein